MSGNLEQRLALMEDVENQQAYMPSYVKEYIESRKLAWSPTTLRNRSYYLNDFIRDTAEKYEKEVTEVLPEELTENAVDFLYSKQYKYTSDLHVKPTSAIYRQKFQDLLNGLFKYLLKKKMIEENPLEDMSHPVGTDERKLIYLTKKEIHQLLEGVRNSNEGNSERDYLIYSLLVYTGMRISALINIDLEDLNIHTWELRVIEKENKVRVYDVSFLKKDLLPWYEERALECRGKDYPLFVSRKGLRCQQATISGNLKRHSKKYTGKEITPHKLRASFAVHFYQKTGDVEMTRQALGHSSIRTTQIYISNHNATPQEIASLTQQVFQI